jgi:hypothetical protein
MYKYTPSLSHISASFPLHSHVFHLSPLSNSSASGGVFFAEKKRLFPVFGVVIFTIKKY